MKEITIKTNNPLKADELLQQFGILMSGGGKNNINSYDKDKHGNYKARCLGDLKYAQFAIKNQGYQDITIID